MTYVPSNSDNLVGCPFDWIDPHHIAEPHGTWYYVNESKSSSSKTSGQTTPELVATVSNAGGLGILGATRMTPDKLLDAVRKN